MFRSLSSLSSSSPTLGWAQTTGRQFLHKERKRAAELYWRQLYWRAPACSTCSAVAAQGNGYIAVQYSRGETEAASGRWQQEDCLMNKCDRTTTKQSLAMITTTTVGQLKA